ncbi:MAG: hypothetical protein NVSMB18_00840 [Acetobacteraceae bacterium]
MPTPGVFGGLPRMRRPGLGGRATIPQDGRMIRALTLLALLLSLATPARAQGDPRAGGFDYFLLSLSVAPSFCALSSRNASIEECRQLTAAEFQQTPLTIHGLWPNRARLSSNRQPQNCPGPDLVLSDGLQAQLRRYMPGGPRLEQHEWEKHGTCSGLDPEQYFAAAAQWAATANDTIGAAMLAQGSTVRIDPLLQAVAARDKALAAAVVVSCRFPRGNREALVEEIRVVLSKDFRPLPAGSVGLGQNSGCPGRAGRIPAPSR